MTEFRYSYMSTTNLAPGGNTVYASMCANDLGIGTAETSRYLNSYESCTLRDGLVASALNIAGHAFTFLSRINAADGSVSITLPATTTGIFEDTTNTDSLSSGDLFDWKITPAGGGTDATGGKILHAHCLDGTNGQMFGASSTGISADTYFTFVGRRASGGTTEDNIEVITRSPCDFTKSWVYVASNSVSGGNPVWALRVNAATSTLSITITASTTGEFEDTAHTVAVADGDTLNYLAQRVGTSGNYQVSGSTLYCNAGANLEGTLQNVGTIGSRYWPVNGDTNGVSSTESDVRAYARSTETIENTYVRVTANTLSVAGFVGLRVGAASSALGCSVTASTTGVFEDTTDTVTPASGDLVNWGVLENGGGGAFTPQTLKWEWPAAAAAGGDPEGSLLHSKLLNGGFLVNRGVLVG